MQSGGSLLNFPALFRCRKLTRATSYIFPLILGVVGRCGDCQAFGYICLSFYMLWHPYICQFVCMLSLYVCTCPIYPGNIWGQCLSVRHLSGSMSVSKFIHCLSETITVGLSYQLITILFGHMQCQVWACFGT